MTSITTEQPAPAEGLPAPEAAAGAPLLDDIAGAVADIAAGRPVIVVDDEDRENEGDIVFAAEAATPELLAFTVRHTSGLVCVPMLGEDLDRLELPLMTARNQDGLGTAYTVTVDARTGVTTGISAADRARTISLLAAAGTEPGDLSRPGHVLPLRYRPGGVLARRGHTEASVDLARLAGMRPAAVIAEVVDDDGSMARLPRLREFADEHGLRLVSIDQLVHHIRSASAPAGPPASAAPPVRRVVETRIPNSHGEWRAVGYRGAADGAEHVALVYGDPAEGPDPLVRLHSECLTGDAFGSHRCDCGTQLEAAMAAIAAEGRGIIVYLRGHEGRGIGLLHKLRAYRLQDSGADTVDANLELGLPADARDFGAGAAVLADLGMHSVRLLSNNPGKSESLRAHGITVTERIPMPSAVTPHNLRYLQTKRDRMGHDLPGIVAAN
ncbi:bifunctional 3,4-dihydroxy-2-butanone-4-phosphate synthase/GTP cyclohydrolase II [Streptomonospora sp. PA3]|uniref:bifunctional 3,4-dihydroxy-2-butanone-4-phosphate synthase/GTP cyclohydrolase II n=1 Tax=Streptomonospora sp. PA3 TaxID=2607326 RepID=UPI0012DDD049|nr:bifunctional 3,4-dihydroxy-2-butanone-4-phosphate synthase/GTP cyclohydrolase II [Streptomonospora sp. PA3]MUL40871.1 bifunctional 3,4-dihydroxy-2-butanone-4-phosphate synthase/GTP cyclohydrolase II [Streptomonospora sp. PA3]